MLMIYSEIQKETCQQNGGAALSDIVPGSAGIIGDIHLLMWNQGKEISHRPIGRLQDILRVI